jgi:Ca-activated chloride channel homolog
MKFDVRSDRSLIRGAGHSRRYVLVSFTAPSTPPKAERLPVNVAFVMDRSGSMGGERKIELVREAVDKAIGMLHPEDRFSLVIYDEQIDVLMESTLASREAKAAARRQLECITSRGSTDLGGGWLRGCEQAALHLNENVPAKCLLLTDGLANHGITDRSELMRHAGELRQRGVLTSTFGVGRDFDERLLQGMADAGCGHSYYIEKAVQIQDLLTSELGETLEIVARDANLQFVLPQGVEAKPLNRFRFERSGESLTIELGNLVSGQEMSIVVELRFPAGAVGDTLSAGVCLADRDRALDAAPVALSWKFADNTTNDTQPRDREVDAAVAELYAAKAREEAIEHNRSGDFRSARAVMSKTAGRIRGYAGNNPVLIGIAESLLREVAEFEAPMSLGDMKARYYSAHHGLTNRDILGKAKRSNS